MPTLPEFLANKAENKSALKMFQLSPAITVESPAPKVVEPPTPLHSPASTPTLPPCTGDANSTATRRKSMQRRIIVIAGNTKPEIRQRGYVYQKNRKQSDPWVPTQRAYGYFRVDVPGQTKQGEVRPALGFCRDRMSAMLKLHQAMQEAGVLDVEKIRERITPVTTFESQSAWWLAEIKAGRIVNSKTRKPIRTNTTDYYSTSVAYLNEVVGNNALASLDNPEARELVFKMKAELKDKERRFCDKTIGETFKVFKRVIASARDEKLKQVYPREWDLAYIGLPKGQQAGAAPAYVHGEGNRPHHQKLQAGNLPSCRGFARGDRNPHRRIACSRNREAHLSRLHGALHPAATQSKG
jgi:hypothetical protein